jgi:hypothetical protein
MPIIVMAITAGVNLGEKARRIAASMAAKPFRREIVDAFAVAENKIRALFSSGVTTSMPTPTEASRIEIKNVRRVRRKKIRKNRKCEEIHEHFSRKTHKPTQSF